MRVFAMESASCAARSAEQDPFSTGAHDLSSTAWMRYSASQVQAVNQNELTSLKALIAYVAHMRGQNEYRVERLFSDRFSIPNATCLPSESYDDAIRYLVDQVS